MPFKALLGQFLHRVPGGLGAIIIDWEGEAVDQVGQIDQYELKVIGAHKGLILDNLRQAVRRAEGNDLEEIVITTSKYMTLIMPINDEYCLIWTQQRGDALGRALFEARRCLRELRREID